MSLKDSKILIYICSAVLLIYMASKVSKSNSAKVDYTFDSNNSTGTSAGEIIAIQKLHDLVQENFLNRSYYEVSTFDTTTWYQEYANYNTKHQALFLGSADGWSYYFYATPAELKMIVDRKIPAHKLDQFLKPFPAKYLDAIPTRSRSYFSIF